MHVVLTGGGVAQPLQWPGYRQLDMKQG